MVGPFNLTPIMVIFVTLTVSSIGTTSCNGIVRFEGGNGTHPRSFADLQPKSIIKKSFNASQLLNYNEHFDFDADTRTQTIELQRQPMTTLSFNQIQRPLHEETHQQGSNGEYKEETFNIQEAGLLDVLIVIDNSASMDIYQELLGSQLEDLLSKIANTNWQIGVVTTDSSCLREGSPITKALYENDPEQARENFRKAIEAGTSGSTVERGILHAVEGLNGNCGDSSQPWTRERSRKAVLIVSDEENCGSAVNEGCPGDPDEKSEYFIANTPSGTRVYGILADQKSLECIDWGWEDPEEYWRLIGLTGGTWGNLCKDSYADTLQEISADIGNTINLEFPLATLPYPGTLMLSIDGKPVSPDQGYIVDGTHITFEPNSIAKDASQLVAKYLTNVRPLRDQYQLSKAADRQSIVVSINNKAVAKNDYLYLPSTQEIKFTDMPPDNATIKVTYRDDVDLPREWTLSEGIVESSIEVRVAGKLTKEWQILDKATIVMNDPPRDGAEVKIAYNTELDFTTHYQVDVDWDEVERIEVIDAGNSELVEFTIVDNELVFPFGEIDHRRAVTAVFYMNTSANDILIPVMHEPLADTLELIIDSPFEECFDFEYEDSRSLALPCSANLVNSVQVSYQYHSALLNRFSTGIDFDKSSMLWQVLVDGTVTNDFTIEGDELVINEGLLTHGSSIELQVSIYR